MEITVTFENGRKLTVGFWEFYILLWVLVVTQQIYCVLHILRWYQLLPILGIGAVYGLIMGCLTASFAIMMLEIFSEKKQRNSESGE